MPGLDCKLRLLKPQGKGCPGCLCRAGLWEGAHPHLCESTPRVCELGAVPGTAALPEPMALLLLSVALPWP